MNTETTQPSETTLDKLRPWLVCFSAALFWFYAFLQMNMFNTISTNLMHDFSVDAVQLANLSAAYLYANAIFLLPAGILLDRLSVRKVVLVTMSLCVVSTGLFAVATSFSFATICHFCVGIGNAFSFLSCAILASRWFPPRRMALVMGLIITFAMSSGVIAQTPLTLLIEHVGWRQAMLVDAALGVISFCIIWFFIQDHPLHTTATAQKEQSDDVTFSHAFIAALRNVQTWLCGVYTSLLNLPIMVLGALWGGLVLQQQHHLSHEQASYVSSMLFIGTIIGAPVIGWLSDTLGLRRPPMLIFAMLSIMSMVAIMFVPDLNLNALIALYLLLGIFTSAQVISYPIISEVNPPNVTGTALSLASILIMGGAAVAQNLFGWLMELRWDGKMVNGNPVFSSDDITRAMYMLLASLIIGLIASFLIKETYCKSYQEKTSNN